MSQKQKPTLYQYAVCPFCCKVKSILSYKQVPHDIVEVHPLNKKEIAFSKDYRKVPIFVNEQGQQINDSTPIMRFIDERYQGPKVFEQDPSKKANEDQWLDWADQVLVRALPPVIYQNIPDALKAFDYITQEGKFSWFQQRTIKYSGALVMKLVAKKSAKSQGIAHPQAHLTSCLKKWGEAIGTGPFLGGETPNGADLAVFGILKSIQNMPAFDLIAQQPQVLKWFERLEKVTAKAA